MADLRDELDENLLILLHDLEDCKDPTERDKLVEDVAKLYRIRLDERKLDDESDKAFWGEFSDQKKERWNKIVDRSVDVGIAVMKMGATLIGYCLISRMHANSIVADSYGVLQRSASFKVIPNLNPEKNL